MLGLLLYVVCASAQLDRLDLLSDSSGLVGKSLAPQGDVKLREWAEAQP